MKVLQVVDTLKLGGAERMLISLSNILYKKGVNISVLLITGPDDLSDELNKDIPIIRLNRTKRFDITKFKELGATLDYFDIIHVHLKHNYRYTAIASKWFSNKRHKLVFHDHSHTYRFSTFSLKLIKDLSFKYILQPRYFIGVNQENCDWALTSLGIKNSNVFLLENTVEQVIYNDDIPHTNGLVVVSNITPIKNLEFAIKIAHGLKEDLTIYGIIKDEVYFKRLQDLIKEFDLNNKVSFIHNCKNVQVQLHNYKLAIHTSFKETGPLVLVEYLAQGLPFLSTSTGQVYNMIKDEIPLCFIEAWEVSDWVLRIKEIKDTDFNDLKRIYKTYFCIDNYGNKCLNIYKSILSS